MKKILCLIMAFVMIFSLAACGKEIVVNKKPHVETSDMGYDEFEIIVSEEFYEYCGMEYELVDLVEEISLFYNGEDAFNIVYEEEYQIYADNLALAFEEMEINYTINGEIPDAEDETADITE